MPTSNAAEPFSFTHAGLCPACDRDATFSADGPYLRSTLRCSECGAVPRHRAIMRVIGQNFPNWRKLSIHESSPGWDPVSKRLKAECADYVASQYDTSVPFGAEVPAPRLPCGSYRSENLEAQTFANGSFDLVITQDVFEHIFEPGKAIAEIARTLKPGGATIMTVPIVMKTKPSRRRARLEREVVVHLLEPQYHGNPIGRDGSLVVIDWGYDIVHYLHHHSGLSFMMVQIDDIDHGIRGDLIEVLVGFKRSVPDL